MAKKRNHRSNGKRLTIPLAVVAGMAAPTVKMWEARGGGVSGVAREAGRILTGYDFWNGTFDIGYMRYGLFPVVAGLCKYESLIDGTLGLHDVALLNDALMVKADNEAMVKRLSNGER